MSKRFSFLVLGSVLVVSVSGFAVIQMFKSDVPPEGMLQASATITVQDVANIEGASEQPVAFNVEPKLTIKDDTALEVHYPSGHLRDVLQDAEIPAVDTVVEDEQADTQLGSLPESASPDLEAIPDIPLENQKWQINSIDATVPEGWSSVAIVIDDLGENRKYSYESIELEAPMTMAFLPYSANVDEMARQAKENGHEVIIHMPMEPMNSDLDVGSIALKVGQSPEVFSEMLDKAFAAMDGYAGINNHMGSRLTQDQNSMNQLMLRLKREGLLFLDSRTISGSVASETAHKYGVPYAVRDVFLDHDPSEEGVRKSLELLVREAKKYGHAIAIGHPKEATVTVLREWVKTLPEKQIALVPVSYSVKRQMKSDQTAQAAQPQSGL